MSYFSLVTVDARGDGRKTLRAYSVEGEAYRDHQLIWLLFPGDEQARDFVFRRRRQQSGDFAGAVLSYYVISQRPPQAVEGLLHVQTKPYAPRLTAGETIRFDLQANPVINRKQTVLSPGVKRGSERHDVIMDSKASSKAAGFSPEEARQAAEAAALAWLLSRGQVWGLRILPQSVVTSGYTQHRLRPRKGVINFSSLEYSGVAEVVEPVALTKALVAGIGHARAFGCGLLLVRRVE